MTGSGKTDSGPTAAERFVRGILPENPVYRQMLGALPDAGRDRAA
jgi:hypothetical protein